jgi:large subunit ribosomal protein L15
MKQHDLGPAEGATASRKRVARGNAGAGGTYAGRGRKGQASRSGGTKRAYFEGGQLPLVRRVPFRRGFKNIFRVRYTPVALTDLEAHFDAGAEVTPEALVAAGVLHQIDEPYKVLAEGDLAKALVVFAPRFSGAAREAIGAAGGTCRELADDYRRAGMGRGHRRQR